MDVIPMVKSILTYKNGNENKSITVLLPNGDLKIDDKKILIYFTTEAHKGLFIKYDDFISLEEQ